jgi:hypothetical protein
MGVVASDIFEAGNWRRLANPEMTKGRVGRALDEGNESLCDGYDMTKGGKILVYV